MRQRQQTPLEQLVWALMAKWDVGSLTSGELADWAKALKPFPYDDVDRAVAKCLETCRSPYAILPREFVRDYLAPVACTYGDRSWTGDWSAMPPASLLEAFGYCTRQGWRIPDEIRFLAKNRGIDDDTVAEALKAADLRKFCKAWAEDPFVEAETFAPARLDREKRLALIKSPELRRDMQERWARQDAEAKRLQEAG